MRCLILIPLLALLTACRGGSPVKDAGATPPWLRPDVTRKIDEPRDKPESLIPGDARWYVRIDGLADWFGQSSGDPLAAHLWGVVKSFQPPKLWKRGADHLGLSSEQAAELFFGKTVAVVDQEIDDVHGVVVLTRIETDDLDKLPEALGLVPTAGQDRIGPFKTYTVMAEEKEYTFALGQRWLLVTESKYADHLRRLASAVAAGTPPIGKSKRFNALLKELPDQRDAVVLVRDATDAPGGGDHHALTVIREGQAINVDYLAEADAIKPWIEDVQESPGVDFGPMPDSVISAVSINVLQNSPPGAGFTNMFLFPRNFKKHVRPAIAPPIVAFLASLPADRVQPNPGVSVPVLGLAVRLTDPDVADELDSIVRGLHFVMSTSRFDLAKGLFGVRHIKAGGLDYHVADFGPVLQSRIENEGFKRLADLPSSAGLTKITFGRINNDYVICSQEAFFHDWKRAREDASLRLESSVEFGGFGLEPRPHLLASFVTRSPKLGALLKDVADYWKRAQAAGAVAPKKPEPKDRPVKAEPKKVDDGIEQPLRWIADGLRHRRSFSMQLWRDDRPRLYGKLRIAGPEAQPAAAQPALIEAEPRF